MKKLGIFIFLIFSAMSTMAQIKISDQHYFERFNSFDTLSYNFKALSDKLSNVKEYSFFLDLKSFGRFEISISPSQLILDESEVFAVAGNQKIRISVHKDVNHWQGFVKKTTRIVKQPQSLMHLLPMMILRAVLQKLLRFLLMDYSKRIILIL